MTGWATRLWSETLFKVIADKLVLIAGVLLMGHGVKGGVILVTGLAQFVIGY